MKRAYVIATILILSLYSVTFVFAQDATFYHEPYRPQYHYSPPCNWLNDPNGLVYNHGEYHLFYQFHPGGLTWGPMHWGHAISEDLVHWETLPVALYPDELGTIFSGSVVIDEHNTAGFGDNAMVAIYSYNTQTQGIAYSTDNGRTWTKYDDNPIIDALAVDFRDPKVFWHDETARWIMSIAAGREIQFFKSGNLLDWEYMSNFTVPGTSGIWEVPDLFPLEIDGQTKWILVVNINGGAPAGGSGTMYFVGDFDGETFVQDNLQEIFWLDYGADNYAGTTFYNAPDNRRIFLGWMNNWVYAENIPTSIWRGSMTIPRELLLAETPDGLRLIQTPIAALEKLSEPLNSWDDLTISDDVFDLEGIHSRTLEIIIELNPGTALRSGISIHHNDQYETRIMYNPMVSQVLVKRSSTIGETNIGGFVTIFGAPVEPVNGQLHLRLLIDESSVEIFINDGSTVITSRTFGDPDADSLQLFAEGGDATFSYVEVNDLTSIWDGGDLDPNMYPTYCG